MSSFDKTYEPIPYLQKGELKVKTKSDLMKKLKAINIDDSPDNVFEKIQSACYDYMNKNNDYCVEYLLENYMAHDEAVDYVIRELEKGGLVRGFHCLATCNLLTAGFYNLNPYGNLVAINRKEVKSLLEKIIKKLKE